ncbi:hypothetical protein NQZ70_06266 [Sorangium sp. Soce836]|nr:hypothetical protein NQZ70_06266 [Sorangium sp. Soce836]
MGPPPFSGGEVKAEDIIRIYEKLQWGRRLSAAESVA